MTTYYVSYDNGSDSSDGLSVGNAFKTLTKLQTVISSSDTAIFEAGYHFSYGVDFTQSGGGVGSRITFLGDIKGEYFSSKGTVKIGSVLSQLYREEEVTPTWIITLSGNYYHFENITFGAGSRASGQGLHMDHSYGHYVYRCHFSQSTRQANALFNHASTYVDVTDYTTFDSCIFTVPGVYIDTPRIDIEATMKLRIYNCVCLGNSTIWAGGIVTCAIGDTPGTDYYLGGIDIRHCTVVGTKLVNSQLGVSNPKMTYGNVFINNLMLAGGTSMWEIPDPTTNEGNFALLAGEGVDKTEMMNYRRYAGGFIGGLTDMDYIRNFGVSPWQLWEPYHSDQKETHVVSAGSASGGQTRDIYGNLRQNSTRTWVYGIFGGTTSIVDTDAVWTGEAQVFTWDMNRGYTTTQGDEDNNELVGIGCTDLMAEDGHIYQVKMMIPAGNDSYTANPPGGSSDIGVSVYSGAEQLFTGTWTLNETAENNWDLHEFDLSVPTGGWTLAKLQGLEVRLWKNDAGAYRVRVAHILIRYQVGAADTPGAVQAYQRPVADAVEQYLSNDTVVLTGAGMQQIILPCPTAASYIITAPYKFDANYTGTKPTMEVKGMVGQAMQSDVATGSSGSWNTDLAVTVTPTEAGFVSVSIYSLDTSGIAECWFGQVSIAAV